jgi:integration host factor subunit alpha
MLMTGKTVTRADLIEAVYHKAGQTRSQSAELVSQILSEISDRLVAGESVKLSGFGIFVVRRRGTRVGRNPRTKVEVSIPPHRAIAFKASDVLKAHTNGESPR